MSIEVIYQGLTIAKGPSFRLQDGGIFVELDGPMPVATQLSLTHGDHALQGQVRRITEGTGAGMLIVPTASQLLPRWLIPLGPTSVTNVELEPASPAPAVAQTAATPTVPATAATIPVGEPATDSSVAAIRIGEPDPSRTGPSEAGGEPVASIRIGEPDPSRKGSAAGDSVPTAENQAAAVSTESDAAQESGGAAASGHTPSEPGEAVKEDEEDERPTAKPTDKKTTSPAAKKKKPRKR